MKQNRRLLAYVIYVLLGGALFVLGCAEIVDAFWTGMGSAFMMVGILRLIGLYRFRKNEAYREKVEIEMQDERNHFLRNKAWAWAGYLFIMIMGVLVIVLRVVGQEQLSLTASYAVCLMVLLYYISYLVLRKKY